MTDVHDKATRRRNMQAVRSKDTKLEMFVRQLLYSRGFRYRLHVKKLPGMPDIVLPKYNSIIFVHGCFWHGHGCPRAKLPKTHIEFWQKKIQSNIERDMRNINSLKELGWRIMVVWGCTLQGKGHMETTQIQERLDEWLHHGTKSLQLTPSGLMPL